MDVSASEVLLGVVLICCVVGVGVGIRWISRRADADMERTRSLLRSRHAVTDEPVAPPRPAMPRGVPGRQRSAAVAPTAGPVTAGDPQGGDPQGGDLKSGEPQGDGPEVDDPESSGRHRVPEELMRASTYWLSPDRVARAKVPAMRTDENSLPHTQARQ